MNSASGCLSRELNSGRGHDRDLRFKICPPGVILDIFKARPLRLKLMAMGKTWKTIQRTFKGPNLGLSTAIVIDMLTRSRWVYLVMGPWPLSDSLWWLQPAKCRALCQSLAAGCLSSTNGNPQTLVLIKTAFWYLGEKHEQIQTFPTMAWIRTCGRYLMYKPETARTKPPGRLQSQLGRAACQATRTDNLLERMLRLTKAKSLPLRRRGSGYICLRRVNGWVPIGICFTFFNTDALRALFATWSNWQYAGCK